MTDDLPLFRAVWRFNAVAIAVAAVVVAFAAAAAVGVLVADLVGGPARPIGVPAPERADATVAGPDAPQDDAPVEPIERIGPFQPLGRTGALYAVVTTERLSPSETFLQGSYRRKQQVAVDWLIYDPGAGSDPAGDAAPARYLIGEKPSLLLDAWVETLPTGRRPAPELFLFARYVREDGDGDGRLTENDAAVIAVAAPDGRDLTPLDLDGAFHSLAPISADEIVIFLRRGRDVAAAHVHIPSRRVLREAVLPRGDERRRDGRAEDR